MSNGLTLTDLIISVWVACVAGVKRRGGGERVSKKEKKEGGKKGEGIPSSLSYTPPPPPLLRLPATQTSVRAILWSLAFVAGVERGRG